MAQVMVLLEQSSEERGLGTPGPHLLHRQHAQAGQGGLNRNRGRCLLPGPCGLLPVPAPASTLTGQNENRCGKRERLVVPQGSQQIDEVRPVQSSRISQIVGPSLASRMLSRISLAVTGGNERR